MSFGTKEEIASRLLAEIDDVIMRMPPRSTIRQHTPENLAWFGRTLASVEAWKEAKGQEIGSLIEKILGTEALGGGIAIARLVITLNQARHDLLMQLPNSGTVAVAAGMTFDYFDGLRKIICLAKEDLLFVDPYLDAEFVSRYLPHICPDVVTRLLTGPKKLATLLPAVDQFAGQFSRQIEVRSCVTLHDRYVLVDRSACYQSGASFKDGARIAPTTLTQILDAFPAVAKTYEDLWAGAKIERP